MTFTDGPISGGTVVVGTGPIVVGDRAKLVTLLDGLPLQAPAKIMLLDSPGGSVIEAERLADTVRSNRLSVGVVGTDMCASACFLLFAASLDKFAQVGARIGVHSVSLNAIETMNTLAITTAMARDAAGYGVPAAIVGRMVTTEPGQMAWLSPDELRSMGTSLYFGNNGGPAPAPPPSASAGQLAAIAPPASLPPSSAFQEGLEDRRAWEAWFNSLPPAAHAGALYWSAQRGLRQPGTCTAPPPDLGAGMFEWGVGCIEAQKRLRPSDIRRKAEPDYRAGWNSL